MTIAAISTPLGVGGIATVRISGDCAVETAQRIFLSKKRLIDLPGNTAVVGAVSENGEKIDEAVALVFRAPNSYTGEDVVEISCHGGTYLVKRVLRAVLNAGAELAAPGEFTKRAFLNGKIDLAESEAVIDLINAKATLSAKAALAVKGGAVSKKISEAKRKLIETAAHLSAWADFPEEDIEEVDTGKLLEIIKSAKKDIVRLMDTFDSGKIIKNGISAAIIGKPNVGKSSLMNALSGYEKSIVTEIPGTTRDVVEDQIDIDGLVLNLADTAGIREAKGDVEKIGVERARAQADTAAIVICVFDGSRELSAEDYEVLEKAFDSTCIAVINKCDLPQKLDEEKLKQKLGKVIRISAKQEIGLDELRTAIIEKAKIKDIDPNEGIIANERQFSALCRALEEVLGAESALESGITLDAVTVSIESAIEHLMELTGEKVSEEVVNEVFHRFCVGK